MWKPWERTPDDSTAHEKRIELLLVEVAGNTSQDGPVKAALLNAHVAIVNERRADRTARNLTFATWALIVSSLVQAIVTAVNA